MMQIFIKIFLIFWVLAGPALMGAALADNKAANANKAAPKNVADGRHKDASELKLGTARVLKVGLNTPQIGTKHFKETLDLSDGELVLTFDDGPYSATTPAVLDALKNEGVRATFFLIGWRATAAPELVRRIVAEGHTVAFHTYSHQLLNEASAEFAWRDISRGIEAVQRALGAKLASFVGQNVANNGADKNGDATMKLARFFRYPGFASTPELLADMKNRGFVVFGADFWASDWNLYEPNFQLQKLMKRVRKARRGIILMHDDREQTAEFLPAFLRSLKDEGYKIVHITGDF